MIGSVLLLSIGMLSACSSKKENIDVSEELQALRKSEQTTKQTEDSGTTTSEGKQKDTKKTKSQSKKVSSEEKNRERYEKVFADYQAMIDYAKIGGTPTDSDYVDFLNHIQTKMNSWVIEGVIRNPQNQRYAFYDVDNNGTAEMFIGLLSTDGKIYETGFYYLNGSEPVLLGESFAGSAGGARSGFQVYNDGTVLSTAWSSGTGEGQAMLYQLDKNNGVATTVETRDVKMGVDDLDSLFGKTQNLHFDLGQLNWKEFEDTASKQTAPVKKSKMDIKGIASGDFSSIEGTWTSSAGYSFTIEGNQFTVDGQNFTLTAPRDSNGHVTWSLAEAKASPPVYVMFPAGTPLSGVRSYTSDESRDRIFLQPQYDAPQDDIVVYYKED